MKAGYCFQLRPSHTSPGDHPELEAFGGRGKNDYLSSHDLEDLVCVVDGRAQLVEEIQARPEDVHTYIASEIKKSLAVGSFVDALPGYLLPDAASQARIPTVLERLKQITGVSQHPLHSFPPANGVAKSDYQRVMGKIHAVVVGGAEF